VWEKIIDQSFHYPADLEALTKTAVLTTLPDIVTEGDQKQRRNQWYLGAAAFATSLLLLLGVSYWLAADNEQVAIKMGARANTGAPDVRFQFIR
jgi:type VI protein secretion system component VasK